MKNPIEIIKGQANWVQERGDKYVATGIDRRGKRFQRVSPNWGYISAINIYRGSFWLQRGESRFLIMRVFN